MTRCRTRRSLRSALGGDRGGPDVRTLREDRWWVQPAVTVIAAHGLRRLHDVGRLREQGLLRRRWPPTGTSSRRSTRPASPGAAWPGRGGTRLRHQLVAHHARRSSCSSGRSASGPPATTTAAPTTGASGSRRRPARWPTRHKRYTGETRLPLILQNLHRYFFYLALLFNVVLTIDAVMAFRMPGDGGHRRERRHARARGQRRAAVALQPLAATPAGTSAAATSAPSPTTRSATGSGRRSPRSTPGTCRSPGPAWSFVALTDLYVRLVAARRVHRPQALLGERPMHDRLRVPRLRRHRHRRRRRRAAGRHRGQGAAACAPRSSASRCSARPTPSWPRAAWPPPWATSTPRTTGRCTSATRCAAARCSTTGGWPSCTPRRRPTGSTSSRPGARCSTARKDGRILQRDFGGHRFARLAHVGRPHRARDDPHPPADGRVHGHRRVHGVQGPAPPHRRRRARSSRRRRLLAADRRARRLLGQGVRARDRRGRQVLEVHVQQLGVHAATGTPWPCGPAPS